MKIGFISLGCCKNLVDSEKMMGMLNNGRHEIVQDAKEAEIIIINTCGFINSAKEEAIATILEMASYKQTGSCKKLIVTGCLAQRYKADLEKEMPEVDAFISISQYPQLHEIIGAMIEDDRLTVFGKSERLLSSKPWTAYLKIAEGCSNHCTYCAIPLIRGDNVSVPLENLVEEAKRLAKRGVKELVLIAQDTTKYGVDLYGKRSLIDLLKAIHKIEGFHWIRILYMYPDEIDEELLIGMTKLPKVVPYFDIPMQHGDNHMLQLMNRRGSVEEVQTLVERIRELFAFPTLRTTYIVGFPQESEDAFENMIDFTKAIRWDRMGAFTYSPEEDTPAYTMEGAIPEEVKEERLAQLMELQEKISYEQSQRWVGQVLEVLVESQEGLTGRYRGRAANSAPDGVDGMITFTSERELPFGTFVEVLVTRALPHDLQGVEKVAERV